MAYIQWIELERARWAPAILSSGSNEKKCSAESTFDLSWRSPSTIAGCEAMVFSIRDRRLSPSPNRENVSGISVRANRQYLYLPRPCDPAGRNSRARDAAKNLAAGVAAGCDGATGAAMACSPVSGVASGSSCAGSCGNCSANSSSGFIASANRSAITGGDGKVASRGNEPVAGGLTGVAAVPLPASPLARDLAVPDGLTVSGNLAANAGFGLVSPVAGKLGMTTSLWQLGHRDFLPANLSGAFSPLWQCGHCTWIIAALPSTQGTFALT